MNKDGMGLGGRQTRREDPVKGGRRRLTGRGGGLGGGMARQVGADPQKMGIFKKTKVVADLPKAFNA